MKLKCFFLILILACVCFPYGPLNVGDPVLVRGETHGKILAKKALEDDTLITIRAKNGRVFQESASYCCRDYPPKKESFFDRDLMLSLGIFGTFTGILPALAIILAISLIIGFVKSGKKAKHMVVHPEEYRKIGDAEKRKELLTALRDDHENYL